MTQSSKAIVLKAARIVLRNSDCRSHTNLRPRTPKPVALKVPKEAPLNEKDSFVTTSTATLPSDPKGLNENIGALNNNMAAMPKALNTAVAQANEPMVEVLALAKELVQEPKASRVQKIAAAINRWALPVMQVLLGAAVLALGIHLMNDSMIVIGSTMCGTGLALCATLIAGAIAPHPLDRVKAFLKRRQTTDPKPYKPGMAVLLDGSP